MNFDIRTAILGLAVGNLVFGLMLQLFQFSPERPQRIPFLTTGKFLQGIGWLLLYERGVLPDGLSFTVGNITLIIGTAYDTWAMYRISQRTVSLALQVFTAAGIIVLCILATPLSAAGRVVVTSFTVMIFFALGGRTMLSYSGGHSLLRRHVGWSMWVMVVVTSVRGTWAALAPEHFTLFSGNTIQLIMFATLYYLMLTNGFSMLLLAKGIADHELRASEARFRSYFELPLIGIAITSPDKGWLDANAKLCAMLGYIKNELMAMTWAELTHPDDLAIDLAQFDRLMAGEIEGYNLEKRFICKDGHTITTHLAVQCVRHPDRSVHYVVALLEDITGRKHLEEQLHQLATTDGLTGVVNRRRFMELATSEIKRAARFDHPLALSVMDIDHFKSINDTYGHIIGDQALIALTRICQGNIRDIDVLARFGGDEFVVLFPEATPGEAQVVMERVLQTLTAQPIDVSGKPVGLTVSVGIAGLVSESISLDTLLEYADQALYQAKEAGRNRVVIGERTVRTSYKTLG